MGAYPSLKVEKARDGDATVLTPYLKADPTQRGTPMTIHEGTSARDITVMFGASCKALADAA